MMSFTTGQALPSTTVTTSKAQTVPDYYTTYLKTIADAGDKAAKGTAATGIADYDPMQTQGYDMVASAGSAYEDYLKDAETTAAKPAAGLDAARISTLMNPYQTNVVDEMARLSQQNMQRNVLPSLKAGFVGAGNLGSQRYAGALGQSLADVQANLTGQQYGALSKGYSEALKAAMDELTLQNEAAKTQLGMAEKAQSMGLTEAGALTKAGAEKQAYEQSKLDYPMKMATAASGLMRGLQMPMTQAEKRVGPLAGAYSQSDLSNVLGILSMLGAMKEGSPGANLIGNVGDWIKNIDWSSIVGGGPSSSDVVNETISNAYNDPSRDLDVINPNYSYD
jgi:hypothetical protein